MRVLRDLIKHPQVLNLFAWDNGKRMTKESREELFQLIKQAHVFCFDPKVVETSWNKTHGSESSQETPALAIPFKVCWFEVLTFREGGKESFLYTSVAPREKAFSDFVAACLGMLVHEISPNVYDIFTVEAWMDKHTMERRILLGEGEEGISLKEVPKDIQKVGTSVMVYRGVSGDTHIQTDGAAFIAKTTLQAWLSAMKSNVMGMEKTNTVLQLPKKDNPKRTQPHEVRRIVRVATKKSAPNLRPISGAGEIDWSHRWEVMGHWRKVDTIGKDRGGDYCVEGFTWVKEHIRGPEEMPLVKKPRVVK